VASVFFRGPKSAPRWYARYRDATGTWRSKRVRVETRKDANKIAAALEAQAERRRYGIEPPEQSGALCGPLMKKWAAALTNRSADTDRSRLENHVLPRWQSARLVDVTLAAIMNWLDDMRDAGDIGSGSQRHALGLLSRFFSWAVERGHAPRNPCRDVPNGRRPRSVPPREVPWVQSDEQALAIMRALPSPFDAAFYIGNRCGMRLGEILGLRLADLDELASGVIRVRYSYAGPLKEDRHGVGKVKWVPAPADAFAVLGPHLERRKLASAGAEAFLFVGEDGEPFDRHQVAYRWRAVRTALGLPPTLNFYRATRHSACSRNLASGAGVDEVAAALGHSSPAITLKHYNHHVRKRFSPILTAGLGLDGGTSGKVLAIGGRNEVTATTESEGDEHAA
jgi:integrase